MAARNPTDFTRWHPHNKFAGDKPFKATQFDAIINDMEMMLDVPQLILSDCFVSILSISAAYESVLKYRVKMKDNGTFVTSGDAPAELSILASVSGAGVTGNIRVSSGASANNSVVFPLASTTTAWQAFNAGGSFNVLAYSALDTYDEIEIEMQRTAGTGSDSVYLLGVGLVAL